MIYLVCENALHAKFVDELIMCRLRDVDDSKGSQWSGVFTDGERFGVLWDAPVEALFGSSEEDPSIVLAEGEWELVEETPEETIDDL